MNYTLLAPPMPDDAEKPVLLLRCATEFEAELRASTLRAAEIEVRVVRGAASTINLGPAFGSPYEVYVRSEDVDRARDALRFGAPADESIGDDDDEGSDEDDLATPDGPVGGGVAFVIGMAFGLFTLFVPYTAAIMLKAPFSGPERAVMSALWVVFFGMLATVLRERFPIASRTPRSERDDGLMRTHFRDSRLALVCWFIMGMGIFGPSTFFFVGVLLLPIMNALKQRLVQWGATGSAGLVDAAFLLVWSVLCGYWTLKHARQRQLARKRARESPRLAR